MPAFPFVGRTVELARLGDLLPRGAGDGGRVALVGGEAGSGKSRLVREAAHRAAADGALVLYGACDSVVRTPYRPFAEALGTLARVTDPQTLRADLGPGGGELTRLLPELAARVGELPEPAAGDPDSERHRLHTAVADLLTAIGARQPVLLVLEDGHWADAPTLLLLRHLARSAADARLLLVATFRDTEADVPADLAEVLVDLRREDGVVRLRLAGLSSGEITELVGTAAGADLARELPELARTIADLTGGNAFLVTELWRSLGETGALEVHDGTARLVRPLSELGTPDSVRELVHGRLSRLQQPTRRLLELAATAGGSFDLALLRCAARLDEAELLAAVDEAVRCGMLEEVAARGLSYRFTHELVRRALYDRLSGLRRAELHLCVGEALEAVDPTKRDLPALAHHFAAAAPLGDTGRAVDHNVRAAHAAVAALAFDEAATCLRTALDLGLEPASQRAWAQLGLGTAHHRAGRAGDALEAFTAAAGTARGLGDARLLAHAAIGVEEACWRPGIADPGTIGLLEEAAQALGEDDSTLRVGVLSGLQRALSYRGEHARSAIVRSEAIETARRLDDRRGLARTLMRAYWAKDTTPMEEILAMLTEAQGLGEQLGDLEIEVEAMSWRVPALMALGHLDAAARSQAELLALAARARQPFMLHVAEHYASTLALSRGRLAEAEAAAERSRDWSRLLTGRDPSGVYGVLMFAVRREQGRLAELAPVVRVLAAGAGGAWRPGLTVLLAELGLVDEAGEQLARVAAEGLDPYRDRLWLASLTYLAEAATIVGDRDVAAQVRAELLPHAGRPVMIGHGVGWYGSADRYLGMLAATLGENDAATAHFARALALERRARATTWVAHTLLEHGRLLRDDARGREMLADAAALAARAGLPAVARDVAALRERAVTPVLPDGLSPREVEILRLVALGGSNREIGAALHISEHTAANHVRSILRKTGCQNRTEAATYAHRHSLVEA